MKQSLSDLSASLFHLTIRIVGDLLSPPACAACDADLSKHNIFCIACASSYAPPKLRHTASIEVLAASEYGGAVATAIQRLKYSGRSDLAEPLGHLLRKALREHPRAVDVIVPVPLHPRRLAERGYNQAALLARAARSELGAPILFRALERTRFAPPQASLDKRARQGILASAFRARSHSSLAGARVGLVDDVLTTGATLEACAAALFQGGARSVTGLVLAETPMIGS